MGEHDIAVSTDKLKFVEEPVRTSSTASATSRDGTTGTANALANTTALNTLREWEAPAPKRNYGLSADAWSRHSTGENLKQTVEENRLTFQDPRTCLGNIEPSSAVKLGIHLLPSRLWRPLHFKHVAFKVFGIPVIFDGPYVNDLPSRLSCLAKREGSAARTVTGFFRKLALCRGEGSFLHRDHALWN
jgi:hypothetical protein